MTEKISYFQIATDLYYTHYAQAWVSITSPKKILNPWKSNIPIGNSKLGPSSNGPQFDNSNHFYLSCNVIRNLILVAIDCNPRDFYQFNLTLDTICAFISDFRLREM